MENRVISVHGGGVGEAGRRGLKANGGDKQQASAA